MNEGINVIKIHKRNRVLIMSARINNEKFDFLLDTGSERSYMSTNKALTKYKKSLNNILKVKGIGKDSVVSHKYVVPFILLKDYKINNVTFIEIKQRLLFKILRVNGIIGWDILKGLNFKLDLYKNKMSIYTDRLVPVIDTPVYFNSSNLVSLPFYNVVWKQKRNMKILIDTGSNYSYLYDESYKNKSSIRRSISIGINGFEVRRAHLLNDIDIQTSNHGKTLNMKNIFVEKEKEGVLSVLGLDAFNDRTMYFMNSENYLYIE